MDTIINLLGGGLSGGLLGILGGLGTAWIKSREAKNEREFKLAERKAKNEHSLAMITAETEATIKETEAFVKRDQIKMDGMADIEESRGRNDAILELSKNTIEQPLIEKMMFNKSKYTAWLTTPIAILLTFLHGIMDVLRTSVRPVITYASIVFSFYVTYIAFDMYDKLGAVANSGEVFKIIMTMLTLLTFTTTTAVGFWFMDKSMSRKFQNQAS